MVALGDVQHLCMFHRSLGSDASLGTVAAWIRFLRALPRRARIHEGDRFAPNVFRVTSQLMSAAVSFVNKLAARGCRRSGQAE